MYNPNVHHRKSIRLKDYDYSSEGAYFITVCCYNHLPIFGSITDGEMALNDCGIIAKEEWLKTNSIRNHIQLGEFVIMPNHMHGILIIEDNNRWSELHSPQNENHQSGAGKCNLSLRSPSGTIGAMIRGYKSAVTKQCRVNGFEQPVWQRNYFEHIIRNAFSHQTIADYISENPARWTNDKFYLA